MQLCILLLFVVNGIVSYDFKCPVELHKKLRLKTKCKQKSPEHYSCLLDEFSKTYKESCTDKADFVRPGQKYVIGLFRKNTDCDVRRYQPFKFWSYQLSQCVFAKSSCNEVGQIMINVGSSFEDAVCRCDHAQGYAFLGNPKDNCYCSPSEEDCTCYKKACPPDYSLASDYQCSTSISEGFSCQDVKSVLDMTKIANKSLDVVDVMFSTTTKAHNSAKILFTIFIFFAPIILIIIILALYVKRHQEKVAFREDVGISITHIKTSELMAKSYKMSDIQKMTCIDQSTMANSKLEMNGKKIESELNLSHKVPGVYQHKPGQQGGTISKFEKPYMEHETVIHDFINTFGLVSFYPEKITLVDVITIRSTPVICNRSHVPWVVLKHLMMMNYMCRDKILQEFMEKIQNKDISLENEDIWSQLSLYDSDIDYTQGNVNPLDILVAIFICSSPSLKNILAAKLFMCKLAIPLFVPTAMNELTSRSSILHSIVLDEKMDNNHFRQILAINSECHIISFVRYGRQSISKSKLINTVLSDINHETFFNENCPLGHTTKVISKGIIEAAWFLPSRETNNLKKITIFLNLRGNSQSEEKQLHLLSRISSVMVILVDLDNLQHKNTQDILINMQHVVIGGIILALDAYKDDYRTSNEICRKFKKLIPVQNRKINTFYLAVNKQRRSMNENKENLLAQLSPLLETVDVEPLFRRIDAETNNDIKQNKVSDYRRKARENVEKILEFIPKDVVDVKELITLLQDKMKKKCQLQIDTIPKMHPFMKMTLDTFAKFSNNDDYFVFFIEWMKLMLNDRSRTVKFDSSVKYHSDWKTPESAKIENRDISEAEKFLKKSRSHLNTAPFLFENLMRECGTIFHSANTCEGFEHVHEIGNKVCNLTKQIPKLAAKLLLLGQPLEILDGDTTHVPLMWVEAVLFHVKEMIQDKRLLSVSVIGLHSSGKSTLLNALFGVQFAVNPDSCTSGVFMQLVPISIENSGFDYIVVFDTKGLCPQRRAHPCKLTNDSKIATFVIGLGNIIILNMKGENASEVKDILQIAVHAFLKLKLVNTSLNLKQSCLFIHQNVSDIGTISKMLEKRQMFAQSLDEMAKSVAEQENVLNIQTFNQMIDFNSEKNVLYFSDLWQGDPPMAPVNPGYCKRVDEVKDSILGNLATKRTTYLTITDTIKRIVDIWTGILKDDYVYSFKKS